MNKETINNLPNMKLKLESKPNSKDLKSDKRIEEASNS